MIRAESLLIGAGCLHFLQIPSTSHLARRMLNLGPDLAKLSPLNGRIVRIFVGAASLLIFGLGLTVVCRAQEIAGTPLGQTLCWLMTVFWSARALAQVWLRRVWPKDAHANFWYFALLTVYLALSVSYAGATLLSNRELQIACATHTHAHVALADVDR
ncbi:MAG: hypothetical protein WDO69_16130 [Pseudomonadota bacterium]